METLEHSLTIRQRISVVSELFEVRLSRLDFGRWRTAMQRFLAANNTQTSARPISAILRRAKVVRRKDAAPLPQTFESEGQKAARAYLRTRGQRLR